MLTVPLVLNFPVWVNPTSLRADSQNNCPQNIRTRNIEFLANSMLNLIDSLPMSYISLTGT